MLKLGLAAWLVLLSGAAGAGQGEQKRMAQAPAHVFALKIPASSGQSPAVAALSAASVVAVFGGVTLYSVRALRLSLRPEFGHGKLASLALKF